MALKITQVRLEDFRSYESLEIEPDPALTILVGPNAIGKTNVVEAVQLLTAADSFRRPQWGECVRWGTQAARLQLHAEGDGRAVDISLEILQSGRRSYRVNGNAKRRISDVTGLIPCVVFTPDDLRIVKDSADRRRGAVDGVGDQLSAAYLASRSEYEKIVRQRNALLKEQTISQPELDVWTTRLLESGEAFASHRQRLFARISSRLSQVYPEIADGERLEATYVASWEKPARGASRPMKSMGEALAERRGEEVARRTTLVGPHRDEILFSVDGRDARSFASQGQQRSIALAWKLAEVGVINDVSGQPPVLLLDDVMSELDETRRHALASFVGQAAQTMITTTNLGYFEESLSARAKVVSLQ